LHAAFTYSLLSGPSYLTVSFKFTANDPVAMVTRFGTKLTETRPPKR